MEKIINWIQNNLLVTVIAGIVLVAIIAVIIIVCAVKSKNKKNKSTAEGETVAVKTKTAETKIALETTEQVSTDYSAKGNEEPISAENQAKEPETTEKVAEPVAEIKKDKPAKKTVAKKQIVKETVKPVKKLSGKWVIELKKEKEYLAKLLASNGEPMLVSEVYTTEEGAREGVTTIIRCVENGKFVIYKDKNGNYYYKLKNANNRLLCVGEIYKSKDQCLKAVDTVKRIAVSSTVAEGVSESARYVEYTPIKVEGYEIKKGLSGKWKIETTDEGKFTAKLYASNGQLMLATEEVAIRKNAEAAIESVKKNSLAGNFIIDKDKFGRFYYKLRNAQKSVICIGEAYESLESCVSALESVRRFAYTAIISDAE